MSLKKELLERVPSSLIDEPHFHALLDHIKDNEIKTKGHLTAFLLQNIHLNETWLNNYRRNGSAMMKTVRDKTIELRVLKKCFDLTQNFLL